jgi:hypothetical protein
MTRPLLIVTCLFASAAFAERSRINVQVLGKQSARVAAQLKKKLCASYECVTPKKGENVKVDAVVYGAVNGKNLELKVFTSSQEPDVTQKFGLVKKGELAPKTLVAVLSAVDGVVKEDFLKEE